mgnify:CR=1 FL=1
MSDTPGYVKNLKKESVVQSVINCLTDAMRNKQLKPGDRIPPEPDLAASMGVARSSVREAIKILTYLGVLESKRSEGTFVCSGFQESMIDPMIYGMILNQDSFDNLMELREMVEAGIMRLASAKYNEEDGRVLEQLTAREFELLRELLSSPGRVFTREILLAKLWGYDFFGDERVVDSHIKNLRHKLGRDYIETVRGVGYRAAKETR